MAPEQLAGKEVTAQSDIYALGLVLYEIFTGKRAFDRGTLAELHPRNADDSQPAIFGGERSRPGSRARDPALSRTRACAPSRERTQRRRRPPGGDPLAAALAAGETPSPQMVAAAGETAGLKPRIALICFAALLLGLAAGVYLSIRNSAIEQLGLDQAPEVLRQKARDVIGSFGYTERPVDSAMDFDYDTDFVNYAEKNDKPHPNWNQIFANQPPVLYFSYRQSPQYLVASDFHDLLLTPGVVQKNDPPTTLSGMINLALDPRGCLLYFQAIPPEKDSESATSKVVDWNPVFTAAGLDLSKFQPAPPIWNSLASSDTRAAWTGLWPGNSRPLREEAAAYHARPVFFALVGEWTQPPRMKPPEASVSKKIVTVAGVLLLISMMAFGVFLARLNHRRGRGDRAGAFRLACFMFAVEMVLWLCRSHLVPGVETFGLFVIAVSTALFISGLTWILYLALEPYVRRYWPQSIISWSRLVSG